MTKKKFVAVMAATALTASMFSMTAFAGEWNTNGGTATVEGGSWSSAPTLEVVLPADLAFGMNPSMLGVDMDESGTIEASEKAQILTGVYQVASYSDVAVHVECKTKVAAAAPATGVDPITFLARAAFTAKIDSTTFELANDTNVRNVVLVQEIPTAAAVIDSEGNATLKFTDAGWGTKAVAATDVKGVVLGTADTTVDFILDAFDESAGVKPTNVSGFRFSGIMNPSTSFQDGEVTVTSVFTLNAITPSEKTGLWTAGSITDGAAITGFDTTVAVAK